MSAHHRRTTPPAGRARSRVVLGGAAMTAVFLSGGTGVAMAHAAPVAGATPVDGGTTPATSGLGGGLINTDVLPDLGIADGAIVNVGQGNTNNTGDIEGDNNTVGNNNKVVNKNRDDDEKDDKHGKKRHKGHDKDDADCDCPEDETKAEKDCPESENTKGEDTKGEDTKPEDTTDKVESVASTDSPAADDSEVKGVSADESIAPSGAADTGDGSLGVAPVASSWSTADTMFTSGGVAAAALLAGAGLQMGRHRRAGAHRQS